MKEVFWNKFIKKSNKSDYEIAKEMNIQEEKLKEIKNGERELPTQRVDDLLKATQNNKTTRDLEYIKALEFFKKNNFAELRKKFNYKLQKDLEKPLGLSKSTISRIEKEQFDRIGKGTLIKVYDFFNDELNIKIDKQNKVKKDNVKDIFILRKIKDTGLSITDFAKRIGISNSTLYKYKNGQINLSKEMKKKIYNELHKLSNNKENEVVNTINKQEVIITKAEDIKIPINFNSKEMFDYIINNCVTNSVVNLYKELKKYFEN